MEKTNLYKKLLIGKKKHLQYQNKLIKSKVNVCDPNVKRKLSESVDSDSATFARLYRIRFQPNFTQLQKL